MSRLWSKPRLCRLLHVWLASQQDVQPPSARPVRLMARRTSMFFFYHLQQFSLATVGSSELTSKRAAPTRNKHTVPRPANDSIAVSADEPEAAAPTENAALADADTTVVQAANTTILPPLKSKMEGESVDGWCVARRRGFRMTLLLFFCTAKRSKRKLGGKAAALGSPLQDKSNAVIAAEEPQTPRRVERLLTPIARVLRPRRTAK